MASATLTAYPRTLADAISLLRNRPGRRLGNNTWLVATATGGAAVVLHATPILTFHADGTTTATTGGYRTVTTAGRLRSLGVALGIRRGVWTLDASSSPSGAAQPFEDGMPVVLGPNRGR